MKKKTRVIGEFFPINDNVLKMNSKRIQIMVKEVMLTIGNLGKQINNKRQTIIFGILCTCSMITFITIKIFVCKIQGVKYIFNHVAL